MTTIPRMATCETCPWHASGATSWAEGDAHRVETGHAVRRTGLADPTVKPHPYTQPLSDPGAH